MYVITLLLLFLRSKELRKSLTVYQVHLTEDDRHYDDDDDMTDKYMQRSHLLRSRMNFKMFRFRKL